MMNKKALFILIGLMVFSVGLASASTLEISALNKPAFVLENSTLSFSFNMTYRGDDYTNISFSNSAVNFGTLAISDILNINGSINETRVISGSVSGLSGRGGENLVVVLNASATDGARSNYSFSVPVNALPAGFCAFGERGGLEISDFFINNLGEGDDEEWYLLDEIEINIDIENTYKDKSISSVIVELKIIDSEGNDVTDDFVDKNEISLRTIRSKDVKTAVFKISEVPIDFNEGKYKIYIKAYSDDEENIQCVDSSGDLNKRRYHEVDIIREYDLAVYARSDLYKMNVACGEKNIIVSFDIYNLGIDNERNVLVVLENSAMGISQKELLTNLRSGKKKEVSFTFDVPAQLDRNFYDVLVRTYYDYNKGDELNPNSYYESSSGISKDHYLRLDILNCKAIEPTISAKLISEARVGESLLISVSLKNNGNSQKTFSVSASDYDSWGSLVSINPSIVQLGAGGTSEVVLTFSPNEGGSKIFNLNVISNGEMFKQPVAFDIADEDNTNIFDGIDGVSLYLLIGIGFLVILILLVLVAKFTKKSKTEF
jgi:hypothetical protein